MVRMEATADDSLAAIRARSRLGIAIAAMIRMMATTISSSISEKPFCFRISIFPQAFMLLYFEFFLVTNDSVGSNLAFAWPNVPVTTVLRELKELLCFQRQCKLLFACR